VGDGPIGVAFDGTSIWVTNRASDTVSKIDPATNAVVATVNVVERPYAVAAGFDHIWVTSQITGSLSKIDPATNAVVATLTGVGGGSYGVAAGSGSMWVTHYGSGTVSRINPTNNTVTETFPVGGMQVKVVGGEPVGHHLGVVVGPRIVGLGVPLGDEEHAVGPVEGGAERRVKTPGGRHEALWGEMHPAVVGDDALPEERSGLDPGSGKAVRVSKELAEPGLAGDPQQQVQQLLRRHGGVGETVSAGVAGSHALKHSLRPSRTKDGCIARLAQRQVDRGFVALFAPGGTDRPGGLQVGP
jgi:YVTN family beta-propeller protein